MTTIIDSISPSERASLLSIAVSTGLFETSEAEALLGDVIDGIASGALGQERKAVACRVESSGPAEGWSYFAPDQYAEGVWNVWWIGVRPTRHGSGLGKQLLEYVESLIALAGGRLVVIETSDSPPLARARRFYASNGYIECGSVPHFYSDGEAKVIFAKRLPAS
ncbi:MAG: GNAT family N-acetyltransferase [Burkholderiaceae bacterium]